ncbi:MAG: Na+/H+ antiporter NhaA [Micrococcales bacterium]
MNFLKVERNVAFLVFSFAILGFALQNSAGADLLDAFKTSDLVTPWVGLTVEGWVFQIGLPVFFFLVGLELKHELTHGAFKNPKAIVVPVLAAVFGVAVPAAIYLAIVGTNSDASIGWPIPTATDVTFALAVFILFGSRLPKAARSFLLAFAVIDDVIGILILGALFLGSPDVSQLAISAGFALAYWISLKYLEGAPAWWLAVPLALLCWYFALSSGLQTTLIGVALALLVPSKRVDAATKIVQPFVGGIVLPLFALFAAAIPLAAVDFVGSAVFWGVLARPVGKVIGVFLGAWIGTKLVGAALPLSTYLRVATLGGVGFTVSLLIAQLSFTMQPADYAAAALATLLAAVASMLVGAISLATAKRT